MKGYLSVFINEEIGVEGKISVNIGFLNDFDYCVELYASDTENYLESIEDQEALNSLKENICFYKTISDDEYVEFYESIEKKIYDKEFFINCTRVYLSGSYDDIVSYLKNNPFLLTKELVLSGYLSLDENTLNDLKKYFSDFSNIKIQIVGNNELVSIDDYEKTMIAINNIVEKVNHYNFSPFEKLIYLYDLIRDRFYVREDKDESASLSRDLTSSLLGDKIVCLGFANIFNAVCEKLGFNSCVFLLQGDEVGHARNLLYLVDSEYDIDGLYFFDTTFDCKRDEDNEFLFSYQHFAKTAHEMESFSSGSMVPVTYKYLTDESLDELERVIPEGNLDMIKSISLLSKTKINHILSLLGRDSVEPTSGIDGDEFYCLFDDVKNMANKPINSNKFIKALYKVRKQQYYDEPTKYLFDMNALTCILINSQFIVEESNEDRLLSALGVHRKYNLYTGIGMMKRFAEENNLEYDIAGVKLVKTLKSVYEKKIEEEKRLK